MFPQAHSLSDTSWNPTLHFVDQDGIFFIKMGPCFVFFLLQDGILWIINSCWPERGGGGKENGEEEEGEGEEGGGEGGGGEHVGDVGTLRGVQLCLLSPLLPIHSGAGSANQFNAKEKEIKQKHILKADISLHTYCKGALIPHIWVVKSSQRCILWRQNRPKWTKSAKILHSLC